MQQTISQAHRNKYGFEGNKAHRNKHGYKRKYKTYYKQAHRNAGSRAKQQEAYATISETKCNKRYHKLIETIAI